MKTLAIIMSVLTFSAMGLCQSNSEELQKFYDAYNNCLQMLKVPDGLRWDAFSCALTTVKIVENNDEFSLPKYLQSLTKYISNEDLLEIAQAILVNCNNMADERGLRGNYKKMQITKCALPVGFVFDNNHFAKHLDFTTLYKSV